MNVINQPNQEILEKLGGIQILNSEKKYRLNRYVIEEKYLDRIVLYNGFSRALMDVNEEEYNNCLNLTRDIDYVDFFFRNYFMVPEDYDETAVLRKLEKDSKLKIDENYLKNTNIYTILPTTGCNARCFYCYELGVATKVMTPDTAEKIAAFIIRRYKSLEKKEDVELRWFGGEPTLNVPVIDTICRLLKDNGVPYRGEITSNGYLFDAELSKKAKDLWNISFAQITIDGTEEVYNKTKAYIYKDDPNPFSRIIQNIRNLISNGIKVSIRMNVDLYNAEDVKKLIEYLHNEYGSDNLIEAYAYPIFEGHGVNRTEEHFEKLVEKLKEIDDILEKNDYKTPVGLDGGVMSHHCMVDGGKELLFAPDGHIGLCEHYVDKEFIGHIDNPEDIDMEVVKTFLEREEDLDICSDCVNYLNCIRLSKCEDLRVCNKYYKQWRTNQIRQKVRLRAKEYYRGQSMTCSCNSEDSLQDIRNSLLHLHDKIDMLFNLLNK